MIKWQQLRLTNKTEQIDENILHNIGQAGILTSNFKILTTTEWLKCIIQ